MDITYDEEADAVYIGFSSEQFVKNKKIDNSTIIDLDKNNQIIRIEILDVSKRIPKNFFQSVKVKNITLEN